VKGEYEYHDNESLLERTFNGFGVVFAISQAVACGGCQYCQYLCHSHRSPQPTDVLIDGFPLEESLCYPPNCNGVSAFETVSNPRYAQQSVGVEIEFL
jgi:hypothetical protein